MILSKRCLLGLGLYFISSNDSLLLYNMLLPSLKRRPRVLKAANKVFDFISCKNSSFSYLNSILTFFQPMRHAETILEACKKLMLISVIPVLEEHKKKMRLLINCVHQALQYIIILSSNQGLETSTFTTLDKLNYQELWVSACRIHLGIRAFTFIDDSTRLLAVREMVIFLLRKTLLFVIAIVICYSFSHCSCWYSS